MECPNCGIELNYDCDYGRGRKESFYGTASNGLHYPSTYEKLGDIYECPNSDGFESEEYAKVYLETIGETIDSLGVDSWGELSCENERGDRFYHTVDNGDELHDGYPC